MKNYYVVTLFTIFLVVLSNSAISQSNYWSNPELVTNSLSNNKNATIKSLNFIENDIYIFWENSENDNSTSIVYRSFYNENEAHILVSEVGVNYTKPQLINVANYYHNSDTSFYIFYQSDEMGISKIYYRIYILNQFSQQQTLTTSASEQTHLQCSNDGRIVWMEENKLMHIKLDKNTYTFDEPVVIDSGNVSFPSVSQIEMDWMGGDNNTVAYIKEVNDSSNIMISEYNNDNGWLEPLTLFTGLQCLNLSYCTGFGLSSILTWDYYNDTSWHIANYDILDPQIYISPFGLPNQSHPKFYSGIIFVKNRYMDIGISSFVYENFDTSNIYTVPYFIGMSGQLEDYEDVSVTANEVTNPQIFSGKSIGCNQYFINIWEEKIDDYWQLKFTTSFECLSNITEKSEDNYLNLVVSPNPAHGESTISFELKKASKIIICVKNLSGKTVELLTNTKLNVGKHSFVWDVSKYQAGTYFLQLQNNHVVETRKIIIVN